MKNLFEDFTEWNLIHSEKYSNSSKTVVNFVFLDSDTGSTKVLIVDAKKSETKWVGD